MKLTINDIDNLKKLSEKTEFFIQNLFDFITPLQQHELYEKLVSLQISLEKTVKELESEQNDL